MKLVRVCVQYIIGTGGSDTCSGGSSFYRKGGRSFFGNAFLIPDAVSKIIHGEHVFLGVCLVVIQL